MYKSRKRCRPIIKWLNDVLEDLRKMDVRDYAELQRIEDVEKINVGSQGSRWAVVQKRRRLDKSLSLIHI